MDNHFSDNLIDQIKEDPNKNYFTNVLIETIKISKVPKKTLDVGMWQRSVYRNFKKTI